MNRKLPSLIGASLVLLCVVCCGASADAQMYAGYSTSCNSQCTMNLPTERDCCGGHRGWYQRNFGSCYPTHPCMGRAGYVYLDPHSCRLVNCDFLGGYGFGAHGSCCRGVGACRAHACCAATPNCSAATGCGTAMKSRGNTSTVSNVAAIQLTGNVTSIPSDVADLLKSEI